MIFFLLSCSSENDYLSESHVITKGYRGQETQIELSSVASFLTTVNLTIDLVDEVKQVVDRSIYYGQNETCRFKDILMPDSSKIFRLHSGQLISQMEQSFNAFYWPFSKENLFNYLSNNDIQIYWPYSKSWDFATIPVITYSSEDGREWNYGYKRIGQADGTIMIDTVIVDNEYIKSNPVWIINRNRTPYEELPNFENGEYVNKSGTLFFSDAVKKNQKKERDIIIGGQMVYIGYINCLNTLDGLWAGGPELKFSWGFIDYSMNGSVNSIRLSLTMDEIGVAKEINACIQSSWTPYQKNNYLLIVEEDGGKNRSMTKTLTSTFGGERSVQVTVPYKKKDDILFDQILERSFIFSEQNKPLGVWKQYQGNNFWFTLPTK